MNYKNRQSWRDKRNKNNYIFVKKIKYQLKINFKIQSQNIFKNQNKIKLLN